MSEVVFLVDEAPEGGCTAWAPGTSILTEADDLASLHANVRDAVRCHYESAELLKIAQLRSVHDNLIPLRVGGGARLHFRPERRT
ncbi:MAG: 2-oxoisovalerate dehydrogenase [Chloroflexota bacterium]|nr:2-oxoisovalerate dehydrogenase [Chloroflexota bacterium]